MAAAHVESAAGMPFGEYLSAGVLQPLGMDKTVLDGSPAHGAAGRLVDLLALAGELLAPSLVSAGDAAKGHLGGLARPGRRPARLRPPRPL